MYVSYDLTKFMNRNMIIVQRQIFALVIHAGTNPQP